MNGTARDRLQGLATLLVWAALTTYAVSFALMNEGAGDVDLKFWFGGGSEPRKAVVTVLVAFLAGFIVTAVLTGISALRRSGDERALRRRIASLEQELSRLRNLPIEEDLHAPPEPEPEPAGSEPEGS
jgi:hypothetical protein